ADKESHEEPKNYYYRYHEDAKVIRSIVEEFGLDFETAHIINGHMPVKSKDGESPIKCGGKLLAIDGGFCKAYQKTTGIAGYTLIYNSNNLRLVSHGPFEGINQAVVQNSDIISTTNVLEVKRQRQRVRDTDNGKRLISQIKILKLLLESYRLDGTN
ncbi:MAG: fructose-bisphosphatase class III, partial [Oscillospiraceae bacterium]|nr:fructose-bisphosphatase class III [Oscillospiraceae bacterium]